MEFSKIRTFQDLEVWKQGHKLVIMTYDITKQFPKDKIFALTSQMRRAAVSVTSNVAEGFSRQSNKEKIQFFSTVRGSLTELENQRLVARDVQYITTEDFNRVLDQLTNVHKLLNAFIKSTRSFETKFKIPDSKF